MIPKNLGNSYFTTADSANSGGAIAALQTLGETGTETSGTTATPASQIPAIQAAISKGANALIVSATDPTALCPTLKSAMSRGITVVTYDSDAPTCRSMFINQASTAQIGTSEVDVLAKQIGDTGQIAIVSAAASATNQNAWIGYMKTELKKYPKMQLVSTVYGNDDPTTATQVTQGLLQQYPNLKGIISPTTVGIGAAAAVLDTAKYRGKIALTGLGTPNEMKKYVADGTVKQFELWNPADLGYLAAYAAVELASGKIKGDSGQTVHRRQARQLHRRRGQHRAARPALRLRLLQHRQVQLLVQLNSNPIQNDAADPARPMPGRAGQARPATRRMHLATHPVIAVSQPQGREGERHGARLLSRAGPARPAGRVPRTARKRLAGDAGRAAPPPAGATTRSSWRTTACSSATWRPTTTRPRSTRWPRPTSTRRWQAEMAEFFVAEGPPDQSFLRLEEIFHLD